MNSNILYVNPSYFNIFIDIFLWYPKVWLFFYFFKLLKIFKPSIEACRAFNYLLLWFVSIYLEVNYLYGNNYYSFIGLYYIRTIICCYLYENIYLNLDFAHLLHHNIIIFMLIISLHNKILSNLWLIRMITIPTLAYISSVFSSLRKCISYHSPKHKNLINKYYRYSFLVCKPLSIIYYYAIFFKNINVFINMSLIDKFIVFLLANVHLIQIYFSYTIIKQLNEWKNL